MVDKKQSAKKKQHFNNRNARTIKKSEADDKSARTKKYKKIKKLLSWTILIGIFLGIIVFLCTSEMFEICSVEIIGSNEISQDTILTMSEINMGQNVFLISTGQIENKIRSNSYIKEVNVKRMLPDKIKIEIEEKQKIYILQLGEMYAYIDKNGDILETSTAKLENLIILQGYLTKNEEIIAGSTLNKEDIERLKDLQKILNNAEKNDIKDKITSINIKNENDYIVTLQEFKKIVYIGNISNIETKMLRTKDIIDKTTEKEGKIFVNGNFNDGFDPYFREESNN